MVHGNLRLTLTRYPAKVKNGEQMRSWLAVWMNYAFVLALGLERAGYLLIETLHGQAQWY